ncbi:hypothetical protein [Malaciobacter marinus]|uniref:hypothetical protein n=1 Tax=Malaciobacter marinus TaxID=505249 RepID=UPI003B00B2DA
MNSNSNCLVFYSRNKKENDITLRFAKENFDVNNYFTVSDYKIGDYYIDLNKYDITDLSTNDWELIHNVIDFNEVIFKDRLLRNINLFEAKKLILKVAKNSIELFSTKEFNYLVVHPVDNYVMDVFIRIAKFYACEVSGISAFFVEGYKRITVYGEHNSYRIVDNDEVQNLKQILTRKFKSYMVSSKYNALYRSLLYYFKYKIKYLFFYLIKYKLLNNKEYDYASTPYSATVDNIYKLFPFKYFTNILEAVNKKSIYVPMHYHPEATIEYWSDNIENVDYITSLIEAVRYFSDNGWKVYLKEHPAMCFRQDINLYKKLKEIDKVFILDPFLETSNIINKFDNFLIWTGSTGIEALINNKTVYFASSNYYYDKKSNEKYEKVYFEKEKEKDEFLRRILSNTIKWKTN